MLRRRQPRHSGQVSGGKAAVLALALLLAACASPVPQPEWLPPVVESEPLPAPVASTQPAPELRVVPVPPVPAAAPAQLPPLRRAERNLLDQLLPPDIPDRAGWRRDMNTAFHVLRLPFSPEYLCAAIAVIEQESSWQSDPVVPGLNRMVWKQIRQRAAAWHVPMFMVEAALLTPSPDGRSYRQRIDSLRTERQMNVLFEDMSREAGTINPALRMQNPIRTGGPMQVSVSFAEQHARQWPYPYGSSGTLRREVFTRRGGVYFGIANLLQYPVSYTRMRYRFADYNAGRYSSRNAALQSALIRLGARRIKLDGDLLIYTAGRAAASSSRTQLALYRLAPVLGLTRQDIDRDLAREKSVIFERTPLYRRVFEIAEQKAGHPLPREMMPRIVLHSPKISRRLTTEWFAGRVEARYQTCLARLDGQ